MKGISRRTRTCAALAATGVVALAGASMAQAQTRPASVGDGVPTGQGSVQLFNYGGWINNAGGAGRCSADRGHRRSPASCLADTDPTGRRHAHDRGLPHGASRRAVRVPEAQGRQQRRAVRSRGLPVQRGHRGPDGLPRAARQARSARRRLARRHERGQLGRAPAPRRRSSALDYIGSGGFPNPGIQPSAGQNNGYDNTLRTIEALNRLGKRSVEAGVGPVYFHNHQQEFRNRYVDNGVLKTAWQIVMERMDTRYVTAEIDVGWSSDAFDDVTGTQSRGADQPVPEQRQAAPHQGRDPGRPGHHAAAVEPARVRPVPGANCVNGQPVAFGTGQIDFRADLHGRDATA